MYVKLLIYFLLLLFFSVIFRTASKVDKKNVFVRGSDILKSFLNRRLTFFICFRIDYSNFKAVFFLSHTHRHKYTNSSFSSWTLFFIASILFQHFLLTQTHIERISFWSLETPGSIIGSRYGLLLLSKARQSSMDTVLCRSLISSSVYNRTAKRSNREKYILHTAR